MKFGITANPDIPSALKISEQIERDLSGDHEVLLEPELASAFGRKGHPLKEMMADVIIAVGGDGTILRALQLTDSEILGVRSGSLGFLAEVDSEDVLDFLPKLAKGDYRLEERLKVKVEVDGKRFHDCTNEAVVHTAHVAKIRQFEVYVDNELAESMKADGLIIATPTGSTSYSLSAGGPIVDPGVEALVVTAIAPFKPSIRPLVVPASSEIRVNLSKPKEHLLVLDGQQEISLKGNEVIRFSGSEKRAKFVRFRTDFYQRIREKLQGQ